MSVLLIYTNVFRKYDNWSIDPEAYKVVALQFASASIMTVFETTLTFEQKKNNVFNVSLIYQSNYYQPIETYKHNGLSLIVI